MRTVMVVLLAAAMTGVAWLSADPARSEQGAERDASPGSGVTVWAEVLHLWLPETLGELASPEAWRELLRDHEGFRRFLERQGRETFRFASTYRCHQLNGGWSEITFLRRPYEDSRAFQELSVVLSGADGAPDRGAWVHVVPEALLDREPSVMLAEMRAIVDQYDFSFSRPPSEIGFAPHVQIRQRTVASTGSGND